MVSCTAFILKNERIITEKKSFSDALIVFDLSWKDEVPFPAGHYALWHQRHLRSFTTSYDSIKQMKDIMKNRTCLR